jgi:putative membrane protein
MTMHMGVVAGATALLALGMAGSCYDPVPRFPHLFSPIPASVLELVVVWAWHAPRLHHLARHSGEGLAVEQAMFFGCGLLLWLSAFGGEQGRGGARTASGIVGLLLTSMHMTLLGALLIFAPRPLYRHLPDSTVLTAMADQQLGGAIMLLAGSAAYLAGGLHLTVKLLREPVGQPQARAS